MPEEKTPARFLSLTRAGLTALQKEPRTPFAPWFSGESKRRLLLTAGLDTARYADYEAFEAFLLSRPALGTSPLYALAAADLRQCYGAPAPRSQKSVAALWQKAVRDPLTPAAALARAGVKTALVPVCPVEPLPPKKPLDGVTFLPIAAPVGLDFSDLLHLISTRRIDSTAALEAHIAAELDRVGAPSAVWRLAGETGELPDPYRARLLLEKAAAGASLDGEERAALAAEGAFLLGGALSRRGMRWQLFLDPVAGEGDRRSVAALFEKMIAKKRLPDTVLCVSCPADVAIFLPLFATAKEAPAPRVYCALDGAAPDVLVYTLTAALLMAPGSFLGLAGDAPDFLAVPMTALYEKALSAHLFGRALSVAPSLSPKEARALFADLAPAPTGRLCRFLTAPRKV